LGGATGRIGDPSGKSVERPLLDEASLTHNVRSLRAFFEKILPIDSGPKPVVLDNNEWFVHLSLIDFLRDVGKHFRVGTMIAKEMVRSRLDSEEGISYTEFSYQILQAYDFGLTWPLLTRSDGKKFGKSESGAIWLSAEKLTPYQFFQYLYGIPDADVIRMLKILTFLPIEEIGALEREMQQADYIPNSAQKLLAAEVTRFVHGKEGLEAALRVTEGMAPGSKAILNSEVLAEIAKDMPNISLDKSDIVGQRYADLAVAVGLLTSKGEASRLVKNGGAYLNNERIDDPAFILSEEHLIGGAYLILSVGKKKRILVRVH
jgi:tyrosyl-tRNA synthetase